jgi:hypothetical protein
MAHFPVKKRQWLVVEIWTPIRSLRNFFFLVGNQKKIFYNFNTATYGGLKNIIFEFYFWQGATATCLQWVQKAPKNTFWGISPVSSVIISLIFFGASPHHSELILILEKKIYYLKKIDFCQNWPLGPPNLILGPKNGSRTIFNQFSSTQWSMFMIHSGPVGGKSKKWASTVVR